MFKQRKRVFANKSNTLYAKPLCPFITDETGYATLSRNSARITPTPRRKPGNAQLR